jgi:hypothetical protein
MLFDGQHCIFFQLGHVACSSSHPITILLFKNIADAESLAIVSFSMVHNIRSSSEAEVPQPRDPINSVIKVEETISDLELWFLIYNSRSFIQDDDPDVSAMQADRNFQLVPKALNNSFCSPVST